MFFNNIFRNNGFRAALLCFVIPFFLLSSISPTPQRELSDDERLDALLNIQRYLTAREIAIEQITQDNSFEQNSGRITSSLFLGRMLSIGERSFGRGTVAIIDYAGKKYFVTAGHMFSQVINGVHIPQKNIRAIISIQGRVLEYRGTDFIRNFTDDFAFVPAPDNFNTDLFLFDDLKLTTKTELRSFGYPMGNFLVSKGFFTKETREAVSHSCLITSGSSGGPLVLIEDGVKKIVGINIKTDDRDLEMYGPVAVSYHVIARDINKHKSKQ